MVRFGGAELGEAVAAGRGVTRGVAVAPPSAGLAVAGRAVLVGVPLAAGGASAGWTPHAPRRMSVTPARRAPAVERRAWLLPTSI